MAILNTDLIYGKGSHLLHFMTQSAEAGKIYNEIGSANGYKFKPVSDEDVAKAVETAFSHFSDAKGKNYILRGEEQATL